MGELAEFISGRAYKQDELLASGKYPVLRVGNFYTNDKWYYSNLELPEKYYAEEGDLLYTWSATFGPHIWIGPRVIYHYHIWKVALKNIFEKDFALQFFEADRVRLLNSTNGSTMIHVTKKDMESKGVLLPDVYEQRTIGDLLKRVDHLIAATQHKIDALEQAKKALLQRLFDQSWRFKGYSDPWEKRKLGDLGSVAMNKRIYKDQTSDEGEIPFYKIGSFGKQADAFISRKLFNEYKKLYPFPKKGDILISASGSIGRTIVYNGEDAYFQDSNIIWIQHDNRLDNTFLHQLFNIIRWSGVEGTTIKRLYNKNILSTQILLPSVEEQRSIGSLLDNVDNLIAATQSRLSSLELLKKALLQDLFI